MQFDSKYQRTMSEVEKIFESALEAITNGLSKLESENLKNQEKDAQIRALTQRVEDQNKEIEKLQARIKFLESKDNIFGSLVANYISANNDQANRIEKQSKEVTEIVKQHVKQLEQKDEIIKEKTAIIQKHHAVMTHLAWD